MADQQVTNYYFTLKLDFKKKKKKEKKNFVMN